MKKNLIATFLVFTLFACKQNPKSPVAEASTTEQVTPTFEIDSVKVNDSIEISKTLTIQFEKQLLVFPSIKDPVLLDSIYQPTQTKTQAFDKKTLQESLNLEMKDSFDKAKKDDYSWGPEFKQTWYENSAMKVKSRTDDFLTLSYIIDGYSGGAHGFYGENYKVFDLKSNKVLQQNDIFKNTKDKKWSEFLKNHFNNKDQKEMLLVDVIPLNNNFYFDDKQITFVYNQYEITAYAAGVVEITIPFSELKEDLTDEFAKRMHLK